jgi:class 3 adenylate cyclase/tetratricopeptide (TPR) repeat protein
MICSNCGTENRPEAKFCLNCGMRLGLVCPNGHPVPAGAAFCDECGASVGGTASAAANTGRSTADPGTAPPGQARPSPTAERRLVSVLFADLVGFTPLSESRDPEEVRDLLTRYFDSSRRIIELYGGTVEKFIGDAVMAVWGTPVAQEDDAERAVRAALDLVQSVTDLGADVGAPDLRARAAVLTGEAAVTIGDGSQGMVAGDLVNTASRIQSAAKPGTVFVGEATRRATEAAIVYESEGMHELKGKAESVALSRAVRVVAGTRGGLRSAGLEAPFVGRDRELRTVKDLFFETGENGRAHLASIIGIAGIGKSRLAWEFYKYFDGLPQITWYHRGRCLSYGEGVAYWALAEMVRMRARIGEGEDQASALAKLHATVEEHVPDPDERRWVEPRLAHLIGLEERSAQDREELFAAWRRFFERLAEQNPTVMVFEDMQWADAALVDFVEYLMEWSKSHPIFVLVLARPELLERRPTWGTGKRNFSTVYLEPLPAESMDQLLAGLVPGLADEVRAKILERAEGIPLYAVETVRMLLDRGLLTQEENAYRPTGSIESLDVPETLQALIAARLDGLTPEERRLVQDAAVLGKTFFKEALMAMSGQREDEVEGLLSGLVRKEILSIQADARSPERGQYGFLQDLVRKVAYDTLSRKERKARHLVAAAYLERTWGADDEEIAEVLASHYLNAYRAVPDAPDAAEVKSKARRTLARAGDWAASLSATQEAQRYFEQAAELADEQLERAELYEQAGRMAWLGGRAPRAREHLEAAISAFDSIGLSHPAARVSAALADVLWGDGRIDQAVERMEQAYGVLSQEEPDEDFATLCAQLGRLLVFSGRTDEAFDRIEMALGLAETLRLPEVLSQALNTKSMLLYPSRSRPEEGMVLLRRALEIALENDLGSAALRAYNNMGAHMNFRDRHQDELDAAMGGVDLARRLGNRFWELVLIDGSIGPLTYLGRWDEAVAVGTEVLEAPDFASLRGSLLNSLAVVQVFVERGMLEAARTWLSRYSDLEATADVQQRAGYQSTLARILRAEGRTKEAMATAEEALTARTHLGIANDVSKVAVSEALEAAFLLGDRPKIEELLGIIRELRPGDLTPFLQAEGARFGARLAAVDAEDDRVDPGFKAAAELFRQMEMPFMRAVTLLEHGEWLVAQDRSDEASPLLAEARSIFDGLKARPWLERLARVANVPTAEPSLAGSTG